VDIAIDRVNGSSLTKPNVVKDYYGVVTFRSYSWLNHGVVSETPYIVKMSRCGNFLFAGLCGWIGAGSYLLTIRRSRDKREKFSPFRS